MTEPFELAKSSFIFDALYRKSEGLANEQASNAKLWRSAHRPGTAKIL
jgi:hypothetical protein